MAHQRKCIEETTFIEWREKEKGKNLFFSFVPPWRQIDKYDIRKPLPKQQRGNCTEKTRHASLLSAAGAGAPGGGCGGRASITVTCSVVGLLLGFAQ